MLKSLKDVFLFLKKLGSVEFFGCRKFAKNIWFANEAIMSKVMSQEQSSSHNDYDRLMMMTRWEGRVAVMTTPSRDSNRK